MDECGWIDIDGVAGMLKLTRVGAYGWLRARGIKPVETMPATEHTLGAAAGRGRALYDPSDITGAIRAWLQEYVDDVWNGDPRRAARWYDHRFGGTVMNGRLAAKLAASKGKRVGAKPLALAPSEQEEIRDRHKRGQSQRLIAQRMGLSRKVVRRVLAEGG